ncbi:MAG TPA: oxidoreductase, partial [Rikenellaceae bacterium]|nr:oxidoreductase [Rikenellaceae bacterium]
MSSHPRIKAAIIGFGRMGEMYLHQMLRSTQWEVRAICDTDPDALAVAANIAPSDTVLTAHEDDIFNDPQ